MHINTGHQKAKHEKLQQPYTACRNIRQRCQMQTRVITNTRTLLMSINRNSIDAEKDMQPIRGRL